MIEFNFPRWLNEWQRETAVYSFLQKQVRFTAIPLPEARTPLTSLAMWFCSVPRRTRQQAYREYTA